MVGTAELEHKRTLTEGIASHPNLPRLFGSMELGNSGRFFNGMWATMRGESHLRDFLANSEIIHLMQTSSRLRILLFLIAATFVFANTVNAGEVEAAFAKSQELNRPLLAIGSSTFCRPCRELHSMLESDVELQKLLKKCVVLKVDSQTADYQNLTSRFSVDASKIPMVYIVLPNGTMMYGSVGKPSNFELSNLLLEAISYASSTGASSTNQMAAQSTSAAHDIILSDASLEDLLVQSRESARSGQLIKAIRLLRPVARLDADSESVRRAKAYVAKLERAIDLWLGDLDAQINDGESIHGAIYRVAEVYVELPEVKNLRKVSGEMLKRYQRDPSTRRAMQQAKHLLKAKFNEDRKECERALVNYRTVVNIHAQSPAAKYALSRIRTVQKKIDGKVAFQ